MRTMNLTRLVQGAQVTERKPLAIKIPLRVDHRNGAGHLDPVYEASLRVRASDRAHRAKERAFVTGTWSADPNAEDSAEEFVTTVTSGADGGESILDAMALGEDGGPFVETSAAAQFGYGTDRSNPTGATREPFPKS